MYKGLEDFNLEDVEGPGHYCDHSSERPIYNTLEEPYWDGPYEPVYNFIEEGKAEHFNSWLNIQFVLVCKLVGGLDSTYTASFLRNKK